MSDDTDEKESIWKRLTRLFRSGPVVRHKIASGEKFVEPQGTARAYKKELSNLYSNSLSSYGQYERMARYADYTEMEFTPEIASAINIYADEITAMNEKGEVINVVSKNAEIKQYLETLFYDILNIEFNLWSWVRNLAKYGDYILFIDASEENGILNLLPIPINEIEREEGYDKKDPFAVRFRWLTQGNMILENWQIVHFRLLGNDNFLPYGSSIIEPARRIWRQLIMIEDAMLVYRIVRSPERRVFKIDVSNVPPDQIELFMEKVKTTLKRSQIIDPTTGRVDLRYNPLSVDEDYFLPTRGGQGSEISSLAGGQFTGDIEDVQYIQGKLFAALMVPKAYLGYEGELGSKATLSQQDVRFARTIERIQRIVLAELNKIAIIHLYLLGYRGEEVADFQLKMANPSTIALQQKLELWRMKFEIAGTAQEGVLDKTTVYRDIFDFSDEKIQEIRQGKIFDKLEELNLESLQLPTEPAAPGEAPLPGAEELPQTLGGPPGGAPEGGETPPPEAPPENPPAEAFIPDTNDDELLSSLRDDETLSEDEVSEKRNPGSEGNDSTIAVDKGKDLFSTGEDQGEMVFGTKKQTASDPNDVKYLNRLISRPFSEHKEKTFDDILEEAIERTSKIDAGIKKIFRKK